MAGSHYVNVTLLFYVNECNNVLVKYRAAAGEPAVWGAFLWEGGCILQ